MGKEMISEQITTRNGQRGFVGPDGKWYPIAGQTPATPNFGERLPGESTADFHKRLRGNLPPADPKPADPKPEDPKPEAAKPSLSQQYATARAAKDYETADRLGKEMWARRYSGKFTVPSVEKNGPRVNVATAQQQGMFNAISANPDKPNPAVFKRAQRIGKTMEAYDVVLDYLLSEGHADTVEEAHYVMMQMDAEYVQSIVEGVGTYKDPVLGPHTPGGKAVRKIVKMGKAAVQGYQGSQAQGLNRLGGAIDAAQKEYQKKVEEQMMPPIDPVAHNKLKRIRKAQELQDKTTGPESDAAGSAVKRLGGSGVNLPPV